MYPEQMSMLILILILLNGMIMFIIFFDYHRQHQLKQARFNYLQDERMEEKFDEYNYRNQLEDERIDAKFQNITDVTEKFPIKNAISSHSQRVLMQKQEQKISLAR